MSNTTIPRSAVDSRVERGCALYRNHGPDFQYVEGSRWLIASATVAGRHYVVDLARETCECADHSYRGVICQHIYAASLAHAHSRPCSCCASRVPGRFLSEVSEDDGLLSWFVGDELCADCIRAGYSV